ncbi:hypothetical protein I6N95_15635 [Vagococcus sp. BWB3-3]|uniref:Uncharacterized protein n=1 Tax=Vagococcus allomyrinae TaxID=2794353 RepID=A0A940SVL3_9ENTE|nr:hypothetical protein [Vagococcus allomyrinae]MBP1042450.1 hypothetical protein [Vagococcus allomyrinae]
MKEVINGNKQRLLRMVGEVVVIGLWLVYFMKFSRFYDKVELLISDKQPLINKLLIFVTYSPKDSFTYFTIGGLLVFLLVLLIMLSYVNKSGPKKVLFWLTTIVNVGLIVGLCKPMVYPLYIIFVLGSVLVLYTIVIFTREVEFDEDNYEVDEEESNEGKNEKKTNDE